MYSIVFGIPALKSSVPVPDRILQPVAVKVEAFTDAPLDSLPTRRMAFLNAESVIVAPLRLTVPAAKMEPFDSFSFIA